MGRGKTRNRQRFPRGEVYHGRSPGRIAKWGPEKHDVVFMTHHGQRTEGNPTKLTDKEA